MGSRKRWDGWSFDGSKRGRGWTALPSSEQDDEAEQRLDGRAPETFNVAVESLVDELFVVVGGDAMEPGELAVELGER